MMTVIEPGKVFLPGWFVGVVVVAVSFWFIILAFFKRNDEFLQTRYGHHKHATNLVMRGK